MNNSGTICFKYFDLAFFSFLAAVSEFLSNKLLDTWNSGFYFSFSIAICLIAMIRWGGIGIVVGVIGGIPGILFSEMSVISGILFYALVNVFLGIPIFLYGKKDRNMIAENHVWLMLYVLASHCSLAVGKGLIILVLTGERTGVIDYFGATFLILVMDIILCQVLQKREGLICDLRYYLADEEGEKDERRKY